MTTQPSPSDYATGTATVSLPARVARSARRPGARLRFVLQTRTERAVWTIRVGPAR
jgi:hypothetical protein